MKGGGISCRFVTYLAASILDYVVASCSGFVQSGRHASLVERKREEQEHGNRSTLKPSIALDKDTPTRDGCSGSERALRFLGKGKKEERGAIEVKVEL